jgi:hypothetical protein
MSPIEGIARQEIDSIERLAVLAAKDYALPGCATILADEAYAGVYGNS